MKYVLFDLDGTLTDPGEGITNSIMYALNKFGISVSDKQELYYFIGPPLVEAFMEKYDFSYEKAYLALKYYREYFTQRGIFENKLYEGIPSLLSALKQEGFAISLATSKPQPFAEKILEHFELAGYFDFIKGSDMNEQHTHKDEIISDVRNHFNINHKDKAVMVGDRSHDIIGAKANNIISIGVLYGYGSQEELKNSGADYISDSVSDLLNLIRNILS